MIKAIKEKWEYRIFKVRGKLEGSGVLVNSRCIWTVAHLTFNYNEMYSVQDAFNRVFSAVCLFVDSDIDFAILFLFHEFPEMPLPYGSLAQGSSYYLFVGFSVNYEKNYLVVNFFLS